MKKILLVDNDDLQRTLFKMVLREYYTIIEASNNSEALKACKRERPDLILMDILKPDIEDTTKEILEINKSSKILGITAYSMIKNKILRAGVQEVLVKPVNKQTLLTKINSHIG